MTTSDQTGFVGTMKAAGQDASRKKKDIGKTEEIPRGKTMTLEYKTWKL